MPFIPIWIFFALVMAALIHHYGDEPPNLFLLINISMGVGVLIYLIYTKIYHYEFRNVYRYLNKYIKE